MSEDTAQSSNKPSWRCFFCHELFTTRAAAALHFGVDEEQQPACRIKASEGGLVRALRETEEALWKATASLHAESADGLAAYRAYLSRHAAAVSVAEEVGYERGLADAGTVPLEALKSSPLIEELIPSHDEWMRCKSVQDRYDLMKRCIDRAGASIAGARQQ